METLPSAFAHNDAPPPPNSHPPKLILRRILKMSQCEKAVTTSRIQNKIIIFEGSALNVQAVPEGIRYPFHVIQQENQSVKGLSAASNNL